VVSGTEESDDENALRETLSFLRMRTGHDFSCYKRGTILRRIGRRMQVNSIEKLPAYLAFCVCTQARLWRCCRTC
jgi:two-component system, chemotaxis family, CheB/CheR fusion protein